MSTVPDPTDAKADGNFGNHRAGYGDRLDRIIATARKGWTLAAGEGLVLVQEIDRLRAQLAGQEALAQLADQEVYRLREENAWLVANQPVGDAEDDLGYGWCPVQIEGETADGRRYYFRARWSQFYLQIASTPEEDPMDVEPLLQGELTSFAAASWMPHALAAALVHWGLAVNQQDRTRAATAALRPEATDPVGSEDLHP